MNQTSVRPADELEQMVQQYSDTLYRICLMILQNESDAEDAVSETFLQYLRKSPSLADADHAKAWLITVARNKSKDLLRSRAYRNHADISTLPISCEDTAVHSDVLETLFQLPEKFKTVMYLHYVEDYKVEEIAKIIGRTPSAVKMRLKKGRELMKTLYLKGDHQCVAL